MVFKKILSLLHRYKEGSIVHLNIQKSLSIVYLVKFHLRQDTKNGLFCSIFFECFHYFLAIETKKHLFS